MRAGGRCQRRIPSVRRELCLASRMPAITERSDESGAVRLLRLCQGRVAWSAAWVGAERLLHQRPARPCPCGSRPAAPRAGSVPPAGPRSRQASHHLEHPAQRCGIDIRPDADDSRTERDLHPASPLGRGRIVLRHQHRHESGSLAHRRCRELLAPDEQLAGVQPVAPRHRRGGRRRVEALGHDPRLLLQAPASPPAHSGDHLEPTKAVGVRTGRTTMIMHRSRTHASRLGSFILELVS